MLMSPFKLVPIALAASDRIPLTSGQVYDGLAQRYPSILGVFRLVQFNVSGTSITFMVLPQRETVVQDTGLAAAIADTLSRWWTGTPYGRVSVISVNHKPASSLGVFTDYRESVTQKIVNSVADRIESTGKSIQSVLPTAPHFGLIAGAVVVGAVFVYSFARGLAVKI